MVGVFMKRILLLFLMCALLLPAGWTKAETAAAVVLDGQPVSFLDGAAPYLDEHARTMVPINEIALALGTEKIWNDREKSAVFIKEEREVAFTVGSETYLVDAEEYPMDTSAVLAGDRMYVPVRYLAEGFGLTVTWDMMTQTVLLHSPGWQNPTDQLQFAQRLLNVLPEQENSVLSPTSLSMAMSMVANGVTGETQKEILNVLGISDLGAHNSQMQTMLQNKEPTIGFANSIWINQGYYADWPLAVDFSSVFQDKITAYYDGAARGIPEENGADVINQWVYEHTGRRIEKVLEQSEWEKFLSAIVNTVTFRDEWAKPFEARYTAKGPFYAPGGEIEKDFMGQTAQFPYFEDAACQAVALPYEHGDISLILILPQSQEKPVLQTVIDGLKPEMVYVKIPKFEVKSQMDMTGTFQKLEIGKAFEDNNPDFSAMYENLPLTAKIEAIIHSAFINVDENGTEAAAATVVGGGGGSAMTEPICFEANRPFYYVLYDNQFQEVLMMGQYVK